MPGQLAALLDNSMEEIELDQETISRTACDAAYLLNEAIRELTIPQHLVTCAKRLEETQRVSETYVASLRRIAMAATVIGVYRVGETRKHFLTPGYSLRRSSSILGCRTSSTSSAIGELSRLFGLSGRRMHRRRDRLQEDPAALLSRRHLVEHSRGRALVMRNGS